MKPVATTFDPTPENEAAEEAALMAGFNSIDIVPVDVEPVKAEEVEPVEEKAVQDQPETLTASEVRAMIDQIKQEHASALQKVHGKFGEFSGRINAIKEKYSVAGGVSPKAKERLATEFPELAAMLFDEDQQSEEKQVAETIPEAPANTAKHEEMSPEDIEEAKELLAFDHPDWEKTVVSPLFNEWVSTLPKSVANKLNSSFDPSFVSGKLAKFKEWQSAKQAVLAEKPAVTIKTDRLEAAITPAGIQRASTSNLSADDEEAALMSSFKKKF